MENSVTPCEVSGLAFGSAGEASADVHRLARVCADEIAGKRFRKGLIDADSVEDAAAMILPRTVNGTGHTGPSEFCATSI